MNNLRMKYRNESSTPVKVLCNSRNTPKEKKSAKFETIENMNTPTRPKLKLGDSSTDVRKICVAVRFRPMNSKETISGGECPFKVTDKEITVNSGSTSTDVGGFETAFSYDHIFWFGDDDMTNFSTQKNVFEDIALPLLDAALEGYNACLFTYGQTGSGKTYSMMGSDYTLCGEGSGIIPRFCNELLIRNQNKEHEVSISYYEIYNEKIHDLLNVSNEVENKTSLRVREHPSTGPYVENLSRHGVDSLNELNVLLAHGNRRRATSATLHNNYSSRSHAILEVSVCSQQSLCSKVSLVDLAGSERVASSFVSEERFREGLSINKSLLTLGKVITALSDQRRGNFIPYRESVLTWLLKESLGGNSRTVMLATVSPSVLSIEETLSTLRYACQARHIVNRVAVNEDPQLKLIRELRQEVVRLQSVRKDFESSVTEKKDTLSDARKCLIKTDMIKYQNDLLNIELKQKAIEEKLQVELSRIGINLQAAEKRKNELEIQNEDLFKKIKCDNIPVFRSNFFENLQNILEPGDVDKVFDTNVCKNDIAVHLQHLDTSINALKSLYASKGSKKSSDNAVLTILENMSSSFMDLKKVVTLES